MKKIRRIGILTSGGDAPGMNCAIRAVVRTASSMGIETVGIRRGYQGMLTGDMSIMHFADVSGITDKGGTMLYTARCEEFLTEEGRKRAIDNCRYKGIEAIIALGGDGTFRGALDMSKMGMPVIGVPCTIDNDIPCTSYTIGFDTACNTAIELIDKLRDTMQSHERCSVVEVMGRNAGNIAINVGVASGAFAILIPERETNIEEEVIERIKDGRLMGRTHFTIIVAEGVKTAQEVGKRIKEETGIDTRVTVLGHVQRGGSPLARDRIIATNMGYHAVKCIADGKFNRVICYDGMKCSDMDIEEALSIERPFDESYYDMVNAIIMG